MILLLFFSLCSTFLHTAEMSSHFISMRKHIEQCPLDCTNEACALKEKIIQDLWYKNIFKQVYCTYHLQKSAQFFSLLRKSTPAIPPLSIKVGLFGQGVICGFTLGAGIVGMLWYLKGNQFVVTKPMYTTTT